MRAVVLSAQHRHREWGIWRSRSYVDNDGSSHAAPQEGGRSREVRIFRRGAGFVLGRCRSGPLQLQVGKGIAPPVFILEEFAVRMGNLHAGQGRFTWSSSRDVSRLIPLPRRPEVTAAPGGLGRRFYVIAETALRDQQHVVGAAPPITTLIATGSDSAALTPAV